MATASLPLPLPEKSVLLHIGPHKTGTSAVQSSFHLARDAHAKLGIHYAGSAYQPYLAARFFTGFPGPEGEPTPTVEHRDALISEVAGSRAKRVVVSSERFADADEAVAREIIESLGGERVYVAITLRPLTKILPSHWQQAVRNGMRTPYKSWLRMTLTGRVDESRAETFWRRHAHDQLVERWAAAAGADKVIVVMADDSDRRAVLNSFERLLGMPHESLVPQGEVVNRSLTLPEIEIIRRVNMAFNRRAWPGALYRAAIRFGAVPEIRDKHSGTDEPAIWTPEWALNRASSLGETAAQRIKDSGVNIMGNVDLLGWRPPDGRADKPPADKLLTLPVEAAALAVVGAIAGAEKITARQAGGPPPTGIKRLRKGVRRRLRRAIRR